MHARPDLHDRLTWSTTAAEGPTNLMPAAVTALAKSARSDRKPYLPDTAKVKSDSNYSRKYSPRMDEGAAIVFGHLHIYAHGLWYRGMYDTMLPRT